MRQFPPLLPRHPGRPRRPLAPNSVGTGHEGDAGVRRDHKTVEWERLGTGDAEKTPGADRFVIPGAAGMTGTDDVLTLLLAFGVAVLSAALLRLIGGPGAGGRIAGVGLPIGFLAAWGWFVGLNFPPEGTFGLTSYIALGGVFLGTALDAMAVRRWPRLIATLSFVTLCVWLALGSPDRMPATPVARIELVLAAIILVVMWLGLLTRLKADHAPGKGADGVMLILLLGAGLGLVALQAEAPAVAGPCLALAMAAAGTLIVVWPMRLPLPLSAAYGGGGAVLGLAQSLAGSRPGTVVPLLVLSLILFVGPTARRLPKATILSPLWFLSLGSIPVGLATVLAYAARSH